MTIPLGAQVRWAEKYQKNSPIIGVVTGYPQARMVEVDGKGAISVGLLEVVGEMANADAVNFNALVAERDALAALVAEQCEAMAQMAPEDAYDDKLRQLASALDEGRALKLDGENLKAKVDELTEWAANAASYLEDFLLVVYGERRPVRSIEPDELRRLADFVFEGT
jgi:hypothetical protein